MEQKQKRKINIIDIAVIILIIAAIAVVGAKLLGSRAQRAMASTVDLWAEVEVLDVRPEIIAEIERQDLTGEKMVSGNSFISGVIEKFWVEDECTVVFLIKTPVAEGAPSPKVGSQELRAGKEFIVKTQGFEMTGLTRYVEFGSYEK